MIIFLKDGTLIAQVIRIQIAPNGIEIYYWHKSGTSTTIATDLIESIEY